MPSPEQRRGRLERRVLQALADAGGSSSTAALNAALGTRPPDLLRVLGRCLGRGLVTRENHPDQGLPRRPNYLYILTEAGRARLGQGG